MGFLEVGVLGEKRGGQDSSGPISAQTEALSEAALTLQLVTCLALEPGEDPVPQAETLGREEGSAPSFGSPGV